jgi:transposase-like protein
MERLLMSTTASNVIRKNDLLLNPDDFPGGIGIWAIIEPIYDTVKGNPLPKQGLHVHARKNISRDIDRTFSKVFFYNNSYNDGFEISYIDAISYTFSKWVGYIPILIYCDGCGKPHSDSLALSVIPHNRRICKNCRKVFYATESSIANRLAALEDSQKEVGIATTSKSDRQLIIQQKDFPGGVRIWTTHNPAVVKTFTNPETEGIHIHCYDDKGNRTIDETFGTVVIDNLLLKSEQVRVYSIQRKLYEHRKTLVSLKCPNCLSMHYDQKDYAYTPHTRHECESCGFKFDGPLGFKSISNPLVEQLQTIKNRI